MSQPSQYTPTTDFSQQEANNASGRSTVNTAALDAEFANIETTTDDICDNLALIQRDDGKLNDLTVMLHTLSPEVLNLIGGFKLRGIWAASTAYSVNDICSSGEYTYRCDIAHTSGLVFDSQYWTQFGFSGGGDAAQSAAAAQVSANDAASSASAAASSAASASASATNASNSATSASGSATTATTKASEASASASNASNSASAAATSAASLPNAPTAGADKYLKSNSSADGWEYLTALQMLASIGANTGTQIHAATAKSSPSDDDEIGGTDSENSFSLIKFKWSVLKQSLVSFDGLFYKADPSSAAFTKTGSSALSIKAGTVVGVAGVKLSFATATAVVMPTLTAGSDYAIYACTDGTIRADANWSAPTGYTTANSRKIGGFHYGLVAPGTTLAGGLFNTSGSPVGGGMVWTQTDVDNIAGINKFSIWDLKFRPSCQDPRGMALVNGSTWVDIYLCSTDTAANGTSKYNTNIASGTVLPKVPAAFGGNGTLAYSALDWWVANELSRANQKRLMLASEFYDAAFGVTESQSIDATSSAYPTTTRNAGYTSKWGIEQATGHHWTWGADASGTTPSAYISNGGRGQSYENTTTKVILGGARASGSFSGSRCSNWNGGTAYSGWNIGLRAACDHVQLV